MTAAMTSSRSPALHRPVAACANAPLFLRTTTKGIGLAAYISHYSRMLRIESNPVETPAKWKTHLFEHAYEPKGVNSRYNNGSGKSLYDHQPFSRTTTQGIGLAALVALASPIDQDTLWFETELIGGTSWPSSEASLTTTQGITFSKTAVAIVFANYYGRHRSRQTFDDGLRLIGLFTLQIPIVKGGRACYREITTDGGLRQLLQNASFCRIMSVDGTQPSGITQHKLPARTVA
ncbi:hypothetical protein An16g08300 [Aspergillus niger]|uniref:Uncharacterized protein n=2 Tax=Aspergillus niger TaxID=5061 RepID=A2R8T6_ASPNC|nr:hypothetical protein An16g08300 [Aspergillus niger]CAK47079.1 hypothetical protein An16g08300 [Aspergillus niger]